jgi:phenylacetate-CoA ligase
MIVFGDQRLDLGDRRLDFEPLGARYVALLRAFVVDTVRDSPFYQARFKRTGIDPERITTFDDFRRIPLLGPTEMGSASELDLLPRRYADSLRTHLRDFPPAERLSKKFATSGSTGNPKVSFYTVADWDHVIDTHDRLIQHVPVECYLRTMSFFHPGHFGGKVFEDSLNRTGYHAESAHFTNDEKRTIAQLYSGTRVLGGYTAIAIPPRTPDGTASKGGAGLTLERLLELDVENFIGRRIKLILTSGASRALPSGSLLEQVWEANELAGAPRTRFLDIYGCSEVAGPLATECEHYAGVHLFPGMTFVEVIDEKTGRHVEDGQTGLVVATGLKTGSRYLRYIVGDEATLVTEPCDCGRATPRLVNIRRVMDRQRLIEGCAAGW